MNESATVEAVEETSPEANIPEADNTPDARAAGDWRDGLTADIRDGLGDVQSVEDLAKGYVSAQQMIGGSIRIPGKDAGSEDWDKFYDRFSDVPGLARYDPEDLSSLYEAAGQPNDIKEYGMEGVSEDFLSMALAAGLNREQVEAMSAYNQIMDDDASSAENEAIESGINSLRQEWGHAFDRKIEEGQRAVSFLEQTAPGLSEALDATGAGNHPAIVRVFQALGANLNEGEGFAGTQSGNSGMTPYEARMQIEEMQNNPQHPYHNGDEMALDRYLELHRFANPE